MKKNSILFTGGGTAGHVIVNLALIPYFQENNWKMDYIGSTLGIEKELVQNIEDLNYHPISTGKLRRYMSRENFLDPFRVLKGIWQAFRIIGQVKPQIIFSKGGFVSVPVVFAAWLRRVPIIIHESDLTPGLANKIATKFANKILTTFPETNNYLPQAKTEYIGAVIRDEIFQGNRIAGFEHIGGDLNKKVLLVMGGSIGSHYINTIIRENLPTLLEQFQIIHICGKGHVDEAYNQKGYTQFEYLNDELKDIYAVTDFILSRAGANAIFEFLALEKPMLLIPLSKAGSRGDQIDNAKSFVKQGIATMIEEEELTTEKLFENLDDLVQNEVQIIKRMQAHQAESPKKKVIQLIYDIKK